MIHLLFAAPLVEDLKRAEPLYFPNDLDQMTKLSEVCVAILSMGIEREHAPFLKGIF